MRPSILADGLQHSHEATSSKVTPTTDALHAKLVTAPDRSSTESHSPSKADERPTTGRLRFGIGDLTRAHLVPLEAHAPAALADQGVGGRGNARHRAGTPHLSWKEGDKIGRASCRERGKM